MSLSFGFKGGKKIVNLTNSRVKTLNCFSKHCPKYYIFSDLIPIAIKNLRAFKYYYFLTLGYAQ